MNFKLLHLGNFETIVWNEHSEKEKKEFFQFLIENESIKAKNCGAQFYLLQHQNTILPISVLGTYSPKENYLSSFLNQIVLYAANEITQGREFSSFQKFIARNFSSLVVTILNKFNVENIVFVNNWLLSTNLYPDLSSFPIKESTSFLVEKFPSKAIVFRSMCEGIDKDLISSLKKLNYKEIICRQVYVINPAEKTFLKKRDNKRDKKLTEFNDQWVWETPNIITAEDLNRIVLLYRELYITKHSTYNPNYTPDYIQEAHKSKILTFYFLRDITSQKIMSFIAVNFKNNVMTVPLSGYDLDCEHSFNLYRLQSWKSMELSVENNVLFHMSSGASHFKINRGGIPFFDKHLVLTSHLSFSKRFIWNVIAFISNKLVGPQMKKYNL